MRFRHSDGTLVHVAYCTNMHPAEDLDGVISQLYTYAGPVRERLQWPLLGVGLWLGASVARQLATEAAALEQLQKALSASQLEVVTLNGFPYEAFQADVVKLAVFRPDWLERERYQYTADLAHVLLRLLPDDVETGSISTLPFGWRDRYPAGGMVEHRYIDEMTALLGELADSSGRSLRLAIEPEPGCVVESMNYGIDVVSRLHTDLIGMCLDACHLAVQFEDVDEVLRQASAANVPIVKAQVSSALRVPDPSNSSWLRDFIEPRFMHQVRQRSGDGLVGQDDLDEHSCETLDGDGELRVHFHVPLHVDDGRTTQTELRHTLRSLVGGAHPITNHLEVETYTWSVLPEAQRPVTVDGLVTGIAGELKWTANELIALGLEPIE